MMGITATMTFLGSIPLEQMSRSKSYTNDEFKQEAEEIEGEYPKIAKALRKIANDDITEFDRNVEESDEKESRLFQFVKEINDLQTPEDYAFRIEQNQEDLAEKFPDWTDSDTVKRILDNLVQKSILGRLFHQRGQIHVYIVHSTKFFLK